jgi:hypothetical protein
VAEISSAFMCASLGIVPTVRHVDYIGSWIDVLRDDDRAIVRAASAASKAADYLLTLARTPANPSKPRTLPITSLKATGRPYALAKPPKCKARPSSLRGRPPSP